MRKYTGKHEISAPGVATPCTTTHSGGYPIDTYNRKTQSVPWFVTAFGLFVALFIVLFGSTIIQGIRTCAYAFELGDETYPDSIAGYTISMDSLLQSPPTSICGQWWTVNLYPVTGSAAGPSPSTAATSINLYFENESTVSSGHPWYFYANCGQSLTGVTYIPSGVQYAARFGYDGTVMGWWGLYDGYTRPTITFSNSGIGASATLYTNHDFIVWIVNNSDWRSRYEGEQWISPVTTLNGNSIAWLVDEDNVAFTADVQYRASSNASWVTVGSYTDYYGHYNAIDSGSYRVVFTYSINGLSRSESSSVYDITVSQSSTLTIDRVVTNPFNGQYVTFQVYGSNISTLIIQFKSSSTSSWRTLDNVTFYDRGSYWESSPVAISGSGQYQIIAYDVYGNYVTYGSLEPETDPINIGFADYIVQLVDYVTAFLQHIPDLFAWMPSEIRGLLIACFSIMVVLGLIGWLKS